MHFGRIYSPNGHNIACFAYLKGDNFQQPGNAIHCTIACLSSDADNNSTLDMFCCINTFIVIF